MRRLIVHADDFGISEPINEGIVFAHQHGVLRSASMMACGAAYEHALQLARANPTLDLGVHLTFIEEWPVLDPASVPSLVDAEGRFHRNAYTFLSRYVRGKIRLAELRRECEAQIEKIRRSDLPLSHVDSHQHMHMLPGVLETVVDVAGRWGIEAMRLPRERLGIGRVRGISHVKRLCELAILRSCCARRRGRMWHTDGFFGFWVGGRLNKASLLRILADLPRRGTFELMCHPGFADPASPYRHWNYDWAGELEALVAPEVAQAVEREHIQLISYRDVVPTSEREGQGQAGATPTLDGETDAPRSTGAGAGAERAS